MWLLIAFVAVPLIEIALFIQVGGLIGLWPTLAIVIGTAIVGTALVRAQGRQTIEQLRGSFNDLRDPTEPLAHGAMIVFSAALLLTPGFFTDFVGFALLLPPVRAAVLTYARQRINIRRFETPPHAQEGRNPMDATIIEGEFEEASDPGARPGEDGASGWTRH